MTASTSATTSTTTVQLHHYAGRHSGPSKVDVAADAIHRIWERTRDNEYLDTLTGQPSTVRGSLQLVFSDIGTPNQDRWNAYDELRQQLVQRGIPAEQVRYMHEAKTDVEKARLLAAARAGHVAVLLGSTEKMGVGTNVQARAIDRKSTRLNSSHT